MEIMVVNPYLTDATQSRKTWDGGGADDNWSTPQNWVGDVAPVANDPLIFAGVVRLNPVNDIAADTAFNGITFNPTSGAFTLSGNRFNLNGGIKNNAAAPNTQKVSNDFIINSTQYVGTDVSSGTRLELDGVISGAGELHVQSANPFQNIFLNGLNTFTGKVRHCECNLWANTLADSGLPCSIGAGSLLELYAVTVDPYFFYSGPTVAFNRPIACINGGYHTTRIQITTGGAVVTFNGVISGDANLDISFPVAGTSVLNGANTITGKISARAQATIQSPTIADIGIPCGFGTGTEVGAFGVNTTVEYTGPTASTNKIISGSGTFKVSVSPVWNALILSGVSTLTGPIIINTGTLIVGNAVVDGSISTASGITNNSRLYYRPIGSVTYANVISGTGTVEKNGPGTLTLSGANTYTGQTLITNGTLSINSIKNVGGGASAIGAPTTAANGTITLGSTATDPCTLVYTGTGDTTNRVIRMYSLGADMTIDQSGSGLLKFTSTLESVAAFNKTLVLQGSTVGTGEISGVIPNTDIFNLVGLSKRGTGTWTLSGANTFTGGTTVNAGTLAANNNAAFSTGTITGNGGTITSTDGIAKTFANVITVPAASTFRVYAPSVGGGQDITLTGALNGAGLTSVFHVDGDAGSSLVFVNRNNQANWLGTIVLGSGTSNVRLRGAGSYALGQYTQLIVDQSGDTGGLETSTTTPTGMTGYFFNIVINAGKKLNIGANSNPGPYSSDFPPLWDWPVRGVISGAGDFCKLGTGIWPVGLRGANTYTGKTFIKSGGLQCNYLVNVGAGPSSFGAPTTIANGTIAIGDGASAGLLSYFGGNSTTDRVIDMAGTTGGATIQNRGQSGILEFTSPFTASGAGAKTLTLSGLGSNTEGRCSLVLPENGGATSLTVAGSTWTMTGVSVHTGPTTVNGGILRIVGTLSATTAVTVNDGTLAGPITTGASATIAGAITVNNSVMPASGIQAGAFGDSVLNVNSLTFSGATSKMVINSTASTFSKIAVTGDQVLGGTVVFPYGIAVNGTYKIMTATGTMSGALPSVANYTDKVLTLQQTGDDLEVVVASGWTIADLEKQVWFDAADAGTIVQVGGFVSQWGDKSGKARNVVQGTGANQPQTGIYAINGVNTITFDGSNDALFSAANALWLNGVKFHIFAVTRDDYTSYNWFMGVYGPVNGSGGSMNVGLDAANTWTLRNGAVYPGFTDPSTYGDPKISVTSFNNFGCDAWINGTYIGGASFPYEALSATALLAIGRSYAGSYYFKGSIGEVIITTGELSTEVRQMVEGYLAWKWGLVAQLPVSHPYKLAPP